MSSEVQRRQVERHCAAAIRALSAQPRAEYRRNRLFLGAKGIALDVPHLTADPLDDSLEHNRGVADAVALRLYYCDVKLHNKLRPGNSVARLVFEILEQLRCESLMRGTMCGVASNVAHAFHRWSQQCLGNGLVESELGLLIYSITQIVRSRLHNQLQDDAVEGLIESVRFRLAPIIGDDLSQLRRTNADQKKFAIHANRIAEAVSEIAQLLDGELADKHLATLRSRNLLPPTNDHDDKYADPNTEDSLGSIKFYEENDHYKIFCQDYDSQVDGSELYRLEQRQALRADLDRMIKAQAISIPRLAQRLKMLFAIPHRSGWHDGEEEGYIDGRRLSQVIAKPGYSRVFKQERLAPVCDTVVCFLIDNSGSMKRQSYEAVAILLDIYCRAMELAGVSTEILGFTTRGWAGGESIELWRKQGAPENPGRLNDALHIVYKNAETSWRRSRYSIASLFNPLHFKEGLDGEALEWASRRLVNRPESRKCLVMISDGAPMDSATSHYNHEYYLDKHLKYVAQRIEQTGVIELRAIGIALDMEAFFKQTITLDLTGTLGNRAFQALEILFPRAPTWNQ